MSENEHDDDNDNMGYTNTHDPMVLTDKVQTSGTSNKNTLVQMIAFFVLYLLFIIIFIFLVQ